MWDDGEVVFSIFLGFIVGVLMVSGIFSTMRSEAMRELSDGTSYIVFRGNNYKISEPFEIETTVNEKCNSVTGVRG